MGMLNQTNFPRLWRLFQWSIGGSCHKRRIVRERIGERRNVLEVGCSVGNIAEVLRDVPNLRYTGVDIDEAALATARQSFRGDPRFQFHQGEIERLDLPEASFDFIILSAILHHVDDEGCRRILRACAELLAPLGTIVVTEPVLPVVGDPRLVRFFNSIEQGRFVRSAPVFEDLVRSEARLQIVGRDEFFLKGSPLGFPRITRCLTLEMQSASARVERPLRPGRQAAASSCHG
jgi:SAM-dependent methyltransferase